jgi:hypothetical protein
VDTQNIDFFEPFGGNPSEATNNLFYSSFGRAKPSWAGITNFIADPLFSSTTEEDYSLLLGSPAIDMGSDVSSVAPRDFLVNRAKQIMLV